MTTPPAPEDTDGAPPIRSAGAGTEPAGDLRGHRRRWRRRRAHRPVRLVRRSRDGRPPGVCRPLHRGDRDTGGGHPGPGPQPADDPGRSPAASPPDVFYASPEQTRQWQDSMFPYGDQIEDVDDFYPALIESYTIDDTLYCLPKDFSNLALVINSGGVGGGRVDRRGHPDDVGRARHGLPDPDDRRPDRSRVHRRGRPRRRVHGPGRWLVHQRGPDRGDGEQRRRTRRR